jgi:predicted nucleic acid-binding protein
VDGYLLDTNIVSYWFDPTKPLHGPVKHKIDSLSQESPFHVSAVTLGEIEYGLRAAGVRWTPRAAEEFRSFLTARFPRPLVIDRHTRIHYGDLRAQLFEKFAPRSRRSNGLRPEEMLDPTTGRELGIQENDVWIASQVLQYNLVLVSHDRMLRIREASPGLRVEDWADAKEGSG